jgi:hypothetical protein
MAQREKNTLQSICGEQVDGKGWKEKPDIESPPCENSVKGRWKEPRPDVFLPVAD